MEFKVTGKQSDNMFKLLEKWYNESEDSNAHEAALLNGLKKFKKLIVTPSPNPKYSDIGVQAGNKKSWIEVKMNHTDQLMNFRFFYDGKKWDTTYAGPSAKFVAAALNTNPLAKKFIADLKAFSKIKNPKIGAGFDKTDPSFISADILRKFFAGRDNQYILKQDKVNISKLIEDHLQKGKQEPAHYMQTADDFYMMGNVNPLKLPNSIPRTNVTGPIAVRVGVRTKGYEIQPEIKFDKKQLPHSAYSILPGSKKKNPFDKYR